ncbi:MAG: DUF444 family protein [Planctomycetes bacterium]|nr:DUF444 family protein [Planctomycetota bacterium]
MSVEPGMAGLLRDERRFLALARAAALTDLEALIRDPGRLVPRAQGHLTASLPQLALPRLRFADPDDGPGGPGEGKGEGKEEADSAAHERGAGGLPAAHELDLERGELAGLLGEALELPPIEPRPQAVDRAPRWTSFAAKGPRSLLHVGRTGRRALRRAVASGAWNSGDSAGAPLAAGASAPGDEVFRARRPARTPGSRALVVHLMDVSGSMGREQKELVRQQAFWTELWLRSQHDRVEVVHIVHDAAARVVDEDTFFRIREAGGTRISAAYGLLAEELDRRLACGPWSVYAFHHSDGDNWSLRDTRSCIELLEDRILPRVQQFAYGQVRSEYGSGQFRHELEAALPGHEALVVAGIDAAEDLPAALRAFLGRGR